MRTGILHRARVAGSRARGVTTSALVAVALVVGTLAGCVPSPTSSPSPSRTTLPTPQTTSLFSTDNEALIAATEAYAAYLAVSDQILADGGARPERLKAVATGEALVQGEKAFSAYATRHWHTVGNTTFDSVKVQGSSSRSVTVYVCDDVSNVDVRDSSGVSLVSEDQEPRTPYEVQFVQRDRRLVLASRIRWAGRNFCQ